MSSTPFTSRSRASRWLRLALAVLALVASHVSVARAALGATCARAGAPGAIGHATALPTAQGTTALGGDVQVPGEVPAPPASAPPCAPSVATPLPLVDVAAAVVPWDASPPVVGPQVRPPSHAPPPPFHPPRAI